MSFDLALEELQFDTVTIEPFSAFDANQAPTYGAAVTYTAQVVPATERIINAQGREVTSTASVIIQERVAVDHRSRITLPTGFIPNQPPIQRVEPLAGLGLDHTRIWL
jgi:hypothetical protein